MRGRQRGDEEFRISGIAERLGHYETTNATHATPDDVADLELIERAATLLSIMPRNQLRATVEKLVSPNDLERSRRAIDALIDAAFAIEDQTGHLRKS